MPKLNHNLILILLSSTFLVTGVAQFQFIGQFMIDARAWLNWFVLAITIAVGLIITLQNQKIVVPKLFNLAFIYISLVAIAAFFAPAFNYEMLWEWGGFVAGVLLFFVLHQHAEPEKLQNNLLVVIFISGVIQSLIGIFQYHNLKLFDYSFYHRNIAVGGFYQVNVMGSYLATTLLTALAIEKKHAPKILQYTIIPCTILIAYVITITNSFTGTLGLFIGGTTIMVYLFLTYQKKIKDSKGNIEHFNPLINPIIWLAIIVIVYVINVSLQQLNVDIKYSAIASNSIPTRIAFIYSSFNMFLDKPIFGHGLGMLIGTIRPYYADISSIHNFPILNSVISHPHNEIAYRIAESGILGILGLLLMVGFVMKMLWKLRFEKGVLYTGLLIPITLHTQTEYPFYHHVMPWILFIVLLYLPSRHFAETYTIRLRPAISSTLSIVIAVLGITVSGIMFDKFLIYQPIYDAYEDNALGRIKGKAFASRLTPLIQDSHYYPIGERKILNEIMLEAVQNNDIKTIDENLEKFLISHNKAIVPSSELIKLYVYTIKKNQKKTIEQLENFVKWYPKYPKIRTIETSTWMNVMKNIFNSGKIDSPQILKKYEKWAKQAIENNALSDYGYSFLIHTLISGKKNNEAINAYQKAINLFPNSKVLKKFKLTKNKTPINNK